MKEKVENWIGETIEALRKNYRDTGIEASGNWGQELESEYKLTSFNVNIKILAPHYTEQLINGRNPNQNQSQDALKAWVGWAGSTFLKDWVQRKGISANPFAVAWKIAREGWNVPNQYNKGNLVSSVITRKRVDELAKSIGQSIVSDVRSNIIGNGN